VSAHFPKMRIRFGEKQNSKPPEVSLYYLYRPVKTGV